MNAALPLWAEILVAALLLLSALFVLTASWGLVRLRHFFLRMHPPGLIYTGATWSVCMASMLYFSMQAGALELRAWIIMILLSITVPITTVLLSRAALFRARRQVASSEVDVPPPPQPNTVNPALRSSETAP